MRTLLLIALAATAFAVSTCGGGDPNCGNICSGWKECTVANLDVAACTEACSEESARETTHADRASDCWECMATRNCAERNVECLDECLGVQGFNERE